MKNILVQVMSAVSEPGEGSLTRNYIQVGVSVD